MLGIVLFLYNSATFSVQLSLTEIMKSLVFKLCFLRRNTEVQIIARRSWLNNHWLAIIFHKCFQDESACTTHNTLIHAKIQLVENFGTESIVYIWKWLKTAKFTFSLSHPKQTDKQTYFGHHRCLRTQASCHNALISALSSKAHWEFCPVHGFASFR